MLAYPFQAKDFPDYLSWFDDEELNKELGPMDEAWLDYVLANTSSHAQFAFFDNHQLIAVAGVALPIDNYHFYFITDLAVRPDLRRIGIGTKVLSTLLVMSDLQKYDEWRTGVMPDNSKAMAFFQRRGWQLVQAHTPEGALIELVYRK